MGRIWVFNLLFCKVFNNLFVWKWFLKVFVCIIELLLILVEKVFGMSDCSLYCWEILFIFIIIW